MLYDLSHVKGNLPKMKKVISFHYTGSEQTDQKIP